MARYVNAGVWGTDSTSRAWVWNRFVDGRENVWYTMKLRVQAYPFTVSGEIFDENGISIGRYSVSDMAGISFEDIQCISFTNWWGGDYYVKNISDVSALSQKPLLTFSYSPSTPAVNESIVFDATGCYDSSRQIANYLWNFGDDTVVSTPNPTISYTYRNTGTFNVVLNTTDSNGLISSIFQTINISDGPVSPAQSPTPASTAAVSQSPAITAAPSITGTPRASAANIPAPTAKFVLQNDTPAPQRLALSPSTVGAVAVAIAAVVVVVAMLKRLYHTKNEQNIPNL